MASCAARFRENPPPFWSATLGCTEGRLFRFLNTSNCGMGRSYHGEPRGSRLSTWKSISVSSQARLTPSPVPSGPPRLLPRLVSQRSYCHGRGIRCGADESDEARVGRLIKPQPNGCWIHGDDPNLYRKQRLREGQRQIHRYVYETLRGPIPEGWVLHHHCETPACCNPDHLEPMTYSEHRRLHLQARRA